VSRCRACDAQIVWAVTEGGRRMPVDAELRPDGNIVLVHREVGRPPTVRVVGKPERDELAAQAARRGEELRLFVSHFASCPEAEQFRRVAA